MSRASMRLVAFLAAVLFVVVAPTAAQSSVSINAHAAVGAGTFGPGCTSGGSEFCDDRSFSFHLAAVSGSSGSPAFGYFDRKNVANGNTFVGAVTCLSVVGNKTAVGGFVTQPSDPPGVPFLVYVADNGPPGPGDRRDQPVLDLRARGGLADAGIPTRLPVGTVTTRLLRVDERRHDRPLGRRNGG